MSFSYRLESRAGILQGTVQESKIQAREFGRRILGVALDGSYIDEAGRSCQISLETVAHFGAALLDGHNFFVVYRRLQGD